MLKALTTYFADISTAGRVEYALLDEQTLMELLVAELTGKSAFANDSGDYFPVDEWRGLTISEHGYISTIDWQIDIDYIFFYREEENRAVDKSPVAAGGSIDFRWIPSHVTSFNIFFLELSGEVDTAGLPRELVLFNVGHNHLSGSFVTADLPKKLEILNLKSNALSGSLDMRSLPISLKMFAAGSNQFTGSLDLQNLPSRITRLDLSENAFSGTLDLSYMPPALSDLRLHENNIAQDKLVIGEFPMNFKHIFLDARKFGAIVNLEGKEMHYPNIGNPT